MNCIYIHQVSNFVNKKVRIKGWIKHIRSSGKLMFIELRDGTGEIQCVVFKGEVGKNEFEKIRKLTIESSITVDGVIRLDKRSKIGYEISVTNLEIIHIPECEYPISPKEHGISFLLEHRHLWLRSTKQIAIQKIRSNVIKSSREFFDNSILSETV